MTAPTEAGGEADVLEWQAILIRDAAVESWLRDALLPKLVSGELPAPDAHDTFGGKESSC